MFPLVLTGSLSFGFHTQLFLQGHMLVVKIGN